MKFNFGENSYWPQANVMLEPKLNFIVIHFSAGSYLPQADVMPELKLNFISNS